MNFETFARWARAIGVALPLGAATAGADGALECHSKYGARRCHCDGFRPHPENARVCTCGHKYGLHRLSEKAERQTREVFGQKDSQLLPVRDPELLAQLQGLLSGTHKEDDNWTRDRGCSVHGFERCEPGCLYHNQAPVPTGYRLKGALRNHNPALWSRYSTMRTAVQDDFIGARDLGEVPSSRPLELHSVASSRPPFDNLGAKDRGAAGMAWPFPQDQLMGGVNEWRLLHGTSHANCDSICKSNFNLRLAGTGRTWKDEGQEKGAPLYGYGICLAERSTKADEYATPTEAGDCHMLVCRALGGRVNHCLTNELDIDELKDAVILGPNHSTLGDRVTVLNKPYREFVLYDEDQVYPEFLLTYERIMDGSPPPTAFEGEVPPMPSMAHLLEEIAPQRARAHGAARGGAELLNATLADASELPQPKFLGQGPLPQYFDVGGAELSATRPRDSATPAVVDEEVIMGPGGPIKRVRELLVENGSERVVERFVPLRRGFLPAAGLQKERAAPRAVATQ